MASELVDPELDDRESATLSLGLLLDYATIEGIKLELPFFVYLLKLARMELNGMLSGKIDLDILAKKGR